MLRAEPDAHDPYAQLDADPAAASPGEALVVHERSIYARVSAWPRWSPFDLRIHGFTFLKFATAVFFAVQLGLTIGLAVTGHYGLGAFTLWSFTMLTTYGGVQLVALFVQHWLLTASVMGGMPIVLGDTMIVCVTIVIFLQDNFALFTDGSVRADRARHRPGDHVHMVARHPRRRQDQAVQALHDAHAVRPREESARHREPRRRAAAATAHRAPAARRAVDMKK
jgi:hypothetical protein